MTGLTRTIREIQVENFSAGFVRALLLLLLSLPVAAHGQDYTYTTNNEMITITRYTGTNSDVTIPDTINGLTVNTIGPNAFRSCTFTNVSMGNSLTAIGTNAFRSCTNLTRVTLGGGLLSIGYAAFSYCTQLGEITLPGHVTSIGILAFGSCSNLGSIAIPASVTNIGNSAFTPCPNLKSITVDSQNQLFSSSDGVLFDKNQTTLLQYPGGVVGSYIIPSSVISIGISAFQYCEQLTGIQIPKNLTNIALQTFGGSPRLNTIEVDTNNLVFASVAGVLFDKNLTTLMVCPVGTVGGYTIPDGVTRIEGYAFYQCNGLTNLLFPSSVVAIGDGALFGCSSISSLILPTSITSIGVTALGASGLRSLTLPKGLTNIADSLFFGCGQLTNVVIPNSVVSIGRSAFVACRGLTNIVIPASVQTIGGTAFSAVSSLEGVFFGGNAPSIESSGFSGANNVTVYYLPGTTGWSSTFAGRPTALWRPLMQSAEANFGVPMNQFAFNITWANDLVVVVESSAELTNPNWSPVSTNALVNGSSYFSDPQWTNSPSRFYRLRSP